jgi:hypothetical protein
MEMLDARPTEFQQIPTVFDIFEWFSPAHTVICSADFHRNPSVEDNGNQRIKVPVESDQSAVCIEPPLDLKEEIGRQ